MLADEVVTYLAGIGSLGLTAGSNLFAVPFPESAPDAAACVVEYGGLPAIRSMGPSIGAPHFEVVRFTVIARRDRESAQACRRLAEDVYQQLDHLAGATLSGVAYSLVRALSPPLSLGQDENGRHRYACSYEATKARST